MPDKLILEDVTYNDDDGVVADGDFFDWHLDIEREVLEKIGDEQALSINARDRAALHERVTGREVERQPSLLINRKMTGCCRNLDLTAHHTYKATLQRAAIAKMIENNG